MFRFLSSLPDSFIFGSMLTAITVSVVAAREGSYLRLVSPHEMVFRKPRAETLAFALIGLYLLGLCLSVFGCVSGYVPLGRAMSTGDWDDAIFDVLAILILCLPGAFFLWMAGPQELSLDLQARRYYLTSKRLVVLRKVRSGSWEHINGVYVRTGGKGSYLVCLTLESGGRQEVKLGRFGNKMAATRMADEVSALLGKWRVEVPLTM